MCNLKELLHSKSIMIFDMDGTLIDSVGVWNAVDETFIQTIRNDGSTTLKADIQSTRDRVITENHDQPDPYGCYFLYLKALYQSNYDLEQLHTLRYKIADDYLKNRIDYKPGADTFIKLLKAKGYHLAIATTTKRRNMDVYRFQNQNIINKANIDDYFDVVYTREDAVRIKPDPFVYDMVKSYYGCTSDQCLVFEDSLVGITAAIAANMDSVVIEDKYSDADREQLDRLSTISVDNYQVLIDALNA